MHFYITTDRHIYNELFSPNGLVDSRTIIANVGTNPRLTTIARLLTKGTVHNGILRIVLVQR